MPQLATQERGRRALRRRWVVLLWLVIVSTVAWYVLLVWKGARAPGRLPYQLMLRAQAGDRVLMIAPHEDDESLGGAVYLRLAVEAGATVYVCLLTNGEGEELGSAWTNRSLRLTARNYRRLGLVRQQETLRALARAGVPPDHVFFLGYPNRGLDQMLAANCWDADHPWRSPFLRTTTSPYPNARTAEAPFCGAAVRADLMGLLRELKPTVVFSCHPEDAHRDHWSAYSYTRLALDTVAAQPGGEWAGRTPVYTYLVHHAAWPVPYGYAPSLPLAPPAALEELAANRWLELPVDHDHRALKATMLATYRSQASAYDLLIRAFVRRNELFATIPDTPLVEGELEPVGNEAEPVRETRALRHQPGADLALVQCHLTARAVNLRVLLAAPPSPRAHFTVLVNFAQPGPDRLQALQYELGLGQATSVVAASARERVTPELVARATGAVAGRVLLVSFPRDWLLGCPSFSVVALSQQGHRVLDHSLTRTYRLTIAGE